MPMGVPMPTRRRALLALVVAALAACAGSRHVEGPAAPREPGTATAAIVVPSPVRLRVGDGPLSKPMANPVLGKAALVLRFPAECEGVTAALVVERVEGTTRRPWLALEARVRPDGTLPLLGIEPGAYFVTATPRGAKALVGGAEVGPQESREVALRVQAAAPAR